MESVPDLDIQELTIINAIITKAVQEGIFEPKELKTVGHIFERIESLVKREEIAKEALDAKKIRPE